MSDRGATSDFQLRGQVTFANLMELRALGEAAIEGGGERVVFDLSDLDNGNSAAVALLIAWFRAAEAAEKAIVFTGVPEEIANIVELSGLTSVLPLEGSVATAEQARFPAEAER